MSASLRQRTEAAAFGLVLAAGGVLPRRAMLALGRLAGSVGAVVDRRHRRIALDNLSRAYGDAMTPREARRLHRRCWRHFGAITFDMLACARYDAARLRTLVRYEGLEHLRAAYGRGRGVLVFSGHYGHWELTALMQAYEGFPLAMVTRPLDNPLLERLLAEVRGRSGNRIVHKRNAVREILRAIRERIGVAIVIDQDARRDGVFVPFFGRPASTTRTLALVALRTGAAVVPTFSLPRPDGGYTIVYEAPVEVEASGDRDADVERLTARCTAIVETWVRRRPELWLWMHRRWKTRPADEPGPPAC